MITKTTAWFMGVASWKTVLVSLVVLVAFFVGITGLISPMVVDATGGLQPFDTTWPLSAADIADGLTAYGPDAVSAYLLFAAVDVPLPIVAGIHQVLLWAWLIKCIGSDRLTAFAHRGWILLAFLPPVFDLSENAAFVWLIVNGAPGPDALISFAAFVHAGKMQSINVVWLIDAVMVIAAVWAWIVRRRQSTQAP